MLENNNIKNTFNNPSLENEDWLQPSELVFDNISDELFPEKKKKRFFWLWFGLFVFVTTSLYSGYMIWGPESVVNQTIVSEAEERGNDNLNQNRKVQIDQREHQDQNGTVQRESQEQKSKVQVNQGENQKSEIQQNLKENKSTSVIEKSEIQNQTSEINNNKVVRQEEKVVDEYPTIFDSEKDVSQSIDSQQSSSTTPSADNLNSVIEYNKTQIGINDLQSTTKTSTSTSLNINDNFQDVIPSTNQKNAFQVLERLEFLPKIKLGMFEIEARGLYPMLQKIEPVNKKESFEPGWRYALSAGVDIWNLKLNENYKTTLSPADFRHSEGKGYNINLGIHKIISPNFFLSSNLSYSSITVESGHNSEVTYDINDEQSNMQNDFNLGMASPLGSITSAVVVNRSSNDPSTDTYSLMLDLNNRHTLRNIDLSFSGNQRLFDFAGFESYLEFGLGVNYLIHVSNDLYEVNIGNTDFTSNSMSITSNQENINRNRAFFLAGLSLEKSLCQKTALSLSYRIKKDIETIHQVNDLNTSLSRHGLNLSLITRL